MIPLVLSSIISGYFIFLYTRRKLVEIPVISLDIKKKLFEAFFCLLFCDVIPTFRKISSFCMYCKVSVVLCHHIFPVVGCLKAHIWRDFPVWVNFLVSLVRVPFMVCITAAKTLVTDHKRRAYVSDQFVYLAN